MTDREAKFEAMLQAIQQEYHTTLEKMEKLKELYNKYKEVINYLIFGVLATIVNFVSYYISARVFRIHEVVSSGIAWF